ncbi:MAG: glycosyltransferase [Alphaproteobacteria bacterium]
MPVVFVLPSFAGGGAERVVLNLAGALDRARFSSEIVVLDGSGPLTASVPSGIPVHDLQRPRLRQAMPALIATLRRLRPHAVVPTLGYLNLALLAARPLLPTTRIFPREANLPSVSIDALPSPTLGRLAYRYLYPRADGVLCNARIVAEALARDCGVPPMRIHLIDNPIDVVQIRAAAAPAVRAEGAGPRLVASGRLTHQKGFDRLIDLFATMASDAHLTILGEGPDRAALEKRAKALGIAKRISFAGFQAQPWAFYAGADAFLLPSRWEGMPNAALEALACGTRVITTPESGGTGEVAAAAAPGAVTVAPWGEGFAAALRAVRAQPAPAPRESLLPERFTLARATDSLARILAS